MTNNMGWQCPVCNGVNAPWVAQCPCGGKYQEPQWTYTDGTIWIEAPRDSTCNDIKTETGFKN
jgi:hypothetical protein